MRARDSPPRFYKPRPTVREPFWRPSAVGAKAVDIISHYYHYSRLLPLACLVKLVQSPVIYTYLVLFSISVLIEDTLETSAKYCI